MLLKKTTKNQVTIPRQLLAELASTDHFEAEVVGDVLVLRPVKVVEMVDINKTRDRLRRRQVRPEDVDKAVSWARENK